MLDWWQRLGLPAPIAIGLYQVDLVFHGWSIMFRIREAHDVDLQAMRTLVLERYKSRGEGRVMLDEITPNHAWIDAPMFEYIRRCTDMKPELIEHNIVFELDDIAKVQMLGQADADPRALEEMRSTMKVLSESFAPDQVAGRLILPND